MMFEGRGRRSEVSRLYVQGESLGSLINGRALGVRRALEFAINLADALADAHAVDMFHGDIRPDTITITPKRWSRTTAAFYGRWVGC
jgi:serine/threonine-protein kinase